MVDINPQSVTWPSPTQYIQSVINANPAGSTFVLKSGVHRMQSISLRTNDTLTFESGAILRGSEDIKNWTWTKDGTNNRWYTTLSSAGSTLNGTARDNYVLLQYNPVLDSEPMAYMNSVSYVNEWTAHYDSAANRLYIGRNPVALTTMELCRYSVAIQGAASNTTGVTVQGNTALPGIIENYASAAQSENAAVKIGRSGSSAIVNANWVCQDLTVRNMRGMSLAHGEDCTVRRVTVYNSGQLGVGGSQGHDSLWENNAVFRCGIGGWRSGWEAGNTKWARVLRHVNRGCWYDSLAPWETIADTHPHLQFTGPLWYDIENDGCEIYANHILDRAHLGGRGVFWEISHSVKIYSNIMYELAHNAENGFWSQSIVFSESGAIPGTSVFPASLVYDNIMYMCSGGVKLVQSSRDSYSTMYSTRYFCNYIDQYRNAISMKTGLGYTGVHGSDGSTIYGAWGIGITSEANLFAVGSLSSSHWREDPDVSGGGIGAVNWANWQANGWDSPDGVAWQIDLDDPKKDFNPYRGGAM